MAFSAQQQPIDFVHLACQTGGDQALEAELLALFAAQCARQLADMADPRRSAGQKRDAAHTLKGAARAIGAWGVAEAAQEVEAALAAGARAKLERMRAELEAAQKLIAELQQAA
jgi:HPt (histidine-containing phosphotransfer) domain-containing protein